MCMTSAIQRRPDRGVCGILLLQCGPYRGAQEPKQGMAQARLCAHQHMYGSDAGEGQVGAFHNTHLQIFKPEKDAGQAGSGPTPASSHYGLDWGLLGWPRLQHPPALNALMIRAGTGQGRDKD